MGDKQEEKRNLQEQREKSSPKKWKDNSLVRKRQAAEKKLEESKNAESTRKEYPEKEREGKEIRTQEVSRRRQEEDLICTKKQQQEGGKRSREEERKQQSRDCRKAQNEWRTRLLAEQRIKAEQRRLDEDMKRWREEETRRREMEDKTNICVSERWRLDHQRLQAEEIMKISRELTRHRPTDETGIEFEGEDEGCHELQKPGEERLERENKIEAEEGSRQRNLTGKKTKDKNDETDTEEDENWHILVKLKAEEDKRKAVQQEREARELEIQTDYYTTTLQNEEFCITQILKPKLEVDKKRAARIEKAKREKEKRCMNLDHRIHKLVSKSTRVPTDFDSERRMLIEKAKATAAREGQLMEEVLQSSKETCEVGRQVCTITTQATRTQQLERKSRVQKAQKSVAIADADMGLSYLFDRLEEENRKVSPRREVQVRSFKKEEPRSKMNSLLRNFATPYTKPLTKPRRVLEPIPFLRFDGSPCTQDSPCKIKYVIGK